MTRQRNKTTAKSEDEKEIHNFKRIREMRQRRRYTYRKKRPRTMTPLSTVVVRGRVDVGAGCWLIMGGARDD